MKQRYRVPFQRNSELVKQLRYEYVQRVMELDAAAVEHKFLYTDEAGFNLAKTRRRGRKVIGQPPISDAVLTETATQIHFSHHSGYLHKEFLLIMEYTLLCLAAVLLTSGLANAQNDATTAPSTTVITTTGPPTTAPSTTVITTTGPPTTAPSTTVITTTGPPTTAPSTTVITTTGPPTTAPSTTVITTTGPPTTAPSTTMETTTMFLLPTTPATEETTFITTTEETTLIPTTTTIFEAPCHNFCDWDEVCVQRNGINGCSCSESNERLNPENFGAIETCYGSSGSLSLSRCQLFDAGYSGMLHLNDPACQGVIEGNRIVFSYDSLDLCGTVVETNTTHLIYKNSAGSTDAPLGVISRVGGLNIAFSCVYPLIQSISMPMAIKAEGGALSKDIANEGTYHITMLPFYDPNFLSPYQGYETLQVNQQIYISVKVEEFNSHQIATVLDSCWATPVDDINSTIRWDLITEECPNPEDATVEILQNGISEVSQFSFKIFTFTHNPGNIYLHCEVHLCLMNNGGCTKSCNGNQTGGHRRRRRRRSLKDSVAISMKFTS
ncbi:pancreatic secretory granule membrane major glycoprotein GP2-like [Trichomycterus rosablanca]|uniref:pancreatic secretory granule membrane major glycoprotein GP2-like n=1 Tax=Trichomycterus rosablanca TaxID=2290929 RepID=UPI002F360C03